MTVLDVGQGLAVVVRDARHALLYDTGPRYTDEADAGGRIVAPFLRAAGVRRLDGMIVTHQDSDHSGGALSLLQTVPVDWLASSLPDDHRDPRAPRARWRRGAALRGRAAVDWDGVRFAVLQPTAALYATPRAKPNDLSCVVRIDSAHGSVLLTGDLEARGELELVRRDPAALKADVLVVPHHGSRTSSTPAFIAAVAPDDRRLHARLPQPLRPSAAGRRRALRRARASAATAPIYDGALTFTFAPGVAAAPARRARARPALLARRAGARMARTTG